MSRGRPAEARRPPLLEYKSTAGYFRSRRERERAARVRDRRGRLLVNPWVYLAGLRVHVAAAEARDPTVRRR